MKLFKYTLIILLPVLIALTGCKLDKPSQVKTESDFNGKTVTTYVALGNSLTAGVQSGSLVEDFQMHSFPKVIANQLGITTFEQPTVSWPGNPNVLLFDPATQSLFTASGTGVPNNLGAAAYQNLGIPTATVWDIVNATSSTTNYRNRFFGETNSAVDLVLRGLGTSMLDQAAAQNPDLVTAWIGSNDVLGFATSGGLKPITPFDVGGVFPSPVTGELCADFKAAFTELADKLDDLDAMVAVANVPDVTSPPFFTTVGPGLAASLQALGVGGLVFEKYGDDLSTGIATGVATPDMMNDQSVLILLTGSSFTDFLGDTTGAVYTLIAGMAGTDAATYLASKPFIDASQPFGFHPQNPWPSMLILDADEIAMVKAATAAYNALIAAKVAEKGFALFDANAFMNSIVANGGYSEQGYSFNASFVTGGMFSLDGIHLTNAGYTIVANQFIAAINETYDMSIAPASIREALGTAPLKKPNSGNVKADLNTLSGLLEITGGKTW